MDAALTLACALGVEERAARRAGARAALVGLGAGLPLPEGRLVSFGLAGGLAHDVAPGTLLTASRVVDESGQTLWEGEPMPVRGAKAAVICFATAVVNEPEARSALAERSGAVAVDMESGILAASGRLVGVVRAVSDSADQPVGALACAGRPDGRTDWKVVLRAFVTEPVASVRTALGGLRALAALRRAAAAIVEDPR